MSLAGVKFSSPELSSLAISQREWREVAGSYGRYRQGRLNINKEFNGWWFYFLDLSSEKPRENTFGRATEVKKMSNLFLTMRMSVRMNQAHTHTDIQNSRVVIHHDELQKIVRKKIKFLFFVTILFSILCLVFVLVMRFLRQVATVSFQCNTVVFRPSNDIFNLFFFPVYYLNLLKVTEFQLGFSFFFSTFITITSGTYRDNNQ